MNTGKVMRDLNVFPTFQLFLYVLILITWSYLRIFVALVSWIPSALTSMLESSQLAIYEHNM